jgi:hypothetical protein
MSFCVRVVAEAKIAPHVIEQLVRDVEMAPT